MFFAYLAFVSCYVSPSVVVPAAYVTGRWCLSYGGNCTAPLHMRLFQPHIYNMINNLKNEKRFFKGAGLRPSASGERHEIIHPSFGLIYNMLKNSKSVTLFAAFFQKNHPGFFLRGNSSKETTITGGICFKKGICIFFIFIGSRLHVICRILVRIDYRPAAR